MKNWKIIIRSPDVLKLKSRVLFNARLSSKIKPVVCLLMLRYPLNRKFKDLSSVNNLNLTSL